jgi:Glycosyltransferase
MGKRILFITQRKLFPMHDGALIGSIGFLKFLKMLDANVDCISFYDKDDYTEHEKEAILKICNSLTSVQLVWKNTALNLSLKYPNSIRKYTRNSMRKTIREMCTSKQYDIVIIDHLQMAEYIKDVNGHITVLSEHNVETEIWENYSTICNWFIKPLVKYNALKMRKYESKALGCFDYVFATTERDRDNLWSLNPEANIKVMHPYSCFDIIKDENSIRKVNKKILFVGSYGWYPNQKAALFLMREVMPLLRTLIEGVTLYLVGKDPTQEMLSYAKRTEDIIITGRVESTDEYYQNCDLFVNPIDDGSGINIKMLEAMGKGIPIVSSRFGLRGFNNVTDEIVSIFSDAQECVDSIARLLNDEEKRLIQRNSALEAYLKFIAPSEEIKRIFQ